MLGSDGMGTEVGSSLAARRASSASLTAGAASAGSAASQSLAATAWYAEYQEYYNELKVAVVKLWNAQPAVGDPASLRHVRAKGQENSTVNLFKAPHYKAEEAKDIAEKWYGKIPADMNFSAAANTELNKTIEAITKILREYITESKGRWFVDPLKTAAKSEIAELAIQFFEKIRADEVRSYQVRAYCVERMLHELVVFDSKDAGKGKHFPQALQKCHLALNEYENKLLVDAVSLPVDAVSLPAPSYEAQYPAAAAAAVPAPAVASDAPSLTVATAAAPVSAAATTGSAADTAAVSPGKKRRAQWLSLFGGGAAAPAPAEAAVGAAEALDTRWSPSFGAAVGAAAPASASAGSTDSTVVADKTRTSSIADATVAANAAAAAVAALSASIGQPDQVAVAIPVGASESKSQEAAPAIVAAPAAEAHAAAPAPGLVAQIAGKAQDLVRTLSALSGSSHGRASAGSVEEAGVAQGQAAEGLVLPDVAPVQGAFAAVARRSPVAAESEASSTAEAGQ
ncbi:MAG: hypothetical protein K0S29_242 [Gammaproteobacteria bacterium]|jgi:hypothetical protein|nr:hypothetical protein [Gammaproteobacteria bacterium]